MNINLISSFACYSISLLRETLLPSLTTQHKKILAIALVTLGCWAALYATSPFYFKNEEVVVEGQLLNDQLNGQGKITYDDGTILEGEFKNDKLHGQATIIYPDEGVTQGIFEKGILHSTTFTQAVTS